MKPKFCKRCVISSFRPNSTIEHQNHGQPKTFIHFDDEGICDACRVAERKQSIDWAERERELRELCDAHRSESGYDCIVPGSGGKDSFYAAHRLKHDFGMHPLTVTWAPHIYTEWGWRNFQRWTRISDNYLLTPNGLTHRILTRLAVENLFHPFQPFVLGQKNYAPKMALLHKIPLVFYGENEAEYGNPIADTTSPNRHSDFFTGRDAVHYLGGVSTDDLITRYGLSPVDLQPYLPAKDTSSLDVRYLGYYLKWHPQSCYYYAVENGGFEASPERTPGTYSKYSSLDDKIDDFHYYCTWVKFGIGRATYDATQEIRSRDITREEGIALAKRFDGEWPERFAQEIFEYLSVPGFEKMDKTRFMALKEKFWNAEAHSVKVWDCEKDSSRV